MFKVENGKVVSCHEESLGEDTVGEETDCLGYLI